MVDLLPSVLLVAGTFLLAGLVEGVIGLGRPTVAMGLLGLAMPPVEAAALLLVPSLVTNGWQLLAGPRFGDLLRRLRGMMLGIVAGTLAAGAGLIAGAAAHAAAAALGGALPLYGIVGLLKPWLRVPPAAEPWAGPLVGAAMGLVTGATGVFVVPAVPYLGSLGLERDDLVQALGLSFTVSTLALAAGLAWHGALPMKAAGASLPALVPALAGMVLGGWLRARVRPETFRLCFFAGLLALCGRGLGMKRWLAEPDAACASANQAALSAGARAAGLSGQLPRMLCSRISLPQFSQSAAIWRRKSSRDPPRRWRPFSTKRRWTSGAWRARLIPGEGSPTRPAPLERRQAAPSASRWSRTP